MKIIFIFLRIKSRIPLIIMGDTGCGKTRLIKFMAEILNIEMYSFNIDATYTVDHSVQGELLPNNIVIISTASPYSADKNSNSYNYTIDSNNNKNNNAQAKSRLKYRVFPLSSSLKRYIWNFGRATYEIEKQYIAVMTRILWNNGKSSIIGNNGKFLQSSDFKQLRALFIELICQSQGFLRMATSIIYQFVIIAD